jgi:hypothetical protein
MSEKNPVGRPNELIDTLEKAKQYLLGEWQIVGDVIPSVAGLACYTGKRRSTIYDYASKNEEFSDILEGILSLQENRLINGSLASLLNPTIAKLILTKHGYSDKQEIQADVNTREIPNVSSDEFV